MQDREQKTSSSAGTERTETFQGGEIRSDVIGNYRLLQKIGEGGMGEVYVAEQVRPVRRKVALKLIKAGMDSKQVVARFESERQALALMSHPTIARVFDGGVTEQGRPFFVMEYVDGIPITEHCDRNRLTTEERLELVIQVCEGVQHAHQKGIIHRDIKPSNVLVQVQNDVPVPKIIDFGVAKATSQRLTERTLFTEMGALVGTLEYMSPEQADLGAVDIDTRTDVYSLGVLLYELLVGGLPLDSKSLRQGGFDEFRRKIREEEPSRPSTRVTSLGPHSGDSARHRRTDPSSWKKALSGDLDWITMKALEKDRTRRYASPGDLAADIRRHLRDEPVVASPPSALYRMGKFVRRHKAGVSAAGIGFMALLLGLAGTTYGLLEARTAQASAAREALAADQQSRFLVGLFEVSNPGEARGNSVTAREILDKGSEKIRQELQSEPLVRARLMGTMGNVYRQLGLYREARSLLEEALATRRSALPEDHPDTLRSMVDLANLAWSQGRYAEAEPLYLRALELRRRVLGNEHEDTLHSTNNLGVLYDNQGRYAEAEPLYLATLALRRRKLGAEHPETLRTMNNLAILYRKQKNYDKAEPLYLATLEVRRRVLGNDHPDTLHSMANLAMLYVSEDRRAEAENLYLDTLRAQKRVVGPTHPDTLTTLYNLACCSALGGDRSRAIGFLREAVEGGWTRKAIFNDSDLTSLHGDPEFEALLAKVRARIDAR